MIKSINEIKKKITPTLKERGVIKAGIFGSYARGEQNKNSDIDILIETKKGFSLIDLIRLEFLLKDLLKKEVDLLTYKGIHPLLKNRILKEEIRII